ncbi:hypothetical protein PV04_09465 [Phialophora macrospora]|uniref:Uncharacterized protein n=1 Tax=Phialophora macrospora TaxID=1851006 RepID=A0A0D2FXA1_9EURO|nr:hypothetical protein PV04_09465 [Phialophora macrospora]
MSSTTPASQVKASSLRILILSPSASPGLSGSTSASPSIPTAPLFPAFLEAITGSKPSADVTTFAGYTSHPPLRLTTKYYARDVGIWCDELPAPTPPSTRASPAQVSSSAGEKDPSNRHEPNAKREDRSRSQSQGTDELEPNTNTDTDTDTDTDIGIHTQSRNPEPEPTLQDWTLQILSPEAREVRAVIAGIVLLLPTTTARASASAPPSQNLEAFIQFIQTAHALREAIEDDLPSRDIASLVVLQPTSLSPTAAAAAGRRGGDHLLEQLEDRCLSEGYLGWDFVAWDSLHMTPSSASGGVGLVSGSGSGSRSGSASDQGHRAKGQGEEEQEETERNEFGEKTGLPRVLEVLEAVDWSAELDFDGRDEAEGEAFDFDADDGSPNIRPALDGSASFSGLDFELQREMMELKMSMLGWGSDEDDEDDVEAGSRERNHPGDDDDHDDDEESQIERFPGLVERVVAIREAGQEMGKDERERFAKREIARIMREMG